MVRVDWTETDAETLFGNNRFFKWIDSLFSRKTHTHTKSQITDFSHTHTKSEITDFSHTHSWSSETLNTYATLYYNEDIRMCHLRYSRSNVTAVANQLYTWHTGLIPEGKRPLFTVNGQAQRNGAVMSVNTGGDINVRFTVAVGSAADMYYSVMWHY